MTEKTLIIVGGMKGAWPVAHYCTALQVAIAYFRKLVCMPGGCRGYQATGRQASATAMQIAIACSMC